LPQKTSRLALLANFVDETLRGNARNWEEKKSFFSYQDLAVRWTTGLARKKGETGQPDTQNRKNGAKKRTGGGTNLQHELRVGSVGDSTRAVVIAKTTAIKPLGTHHLC
jgi:hypothetical protein